MAEKVKNLNKRDQRDLNYNNHQDRKDKKKDIFYFNGEYFFL